MDKLLEDLLIISDNDIIEVVEIEEKKIDYYKQDKNFIENPFRFSYGCKCETCKVLKIQIDCL
tara:strand:- start:300 stop:488 length:189 start_codon:yes stop_codon:yes gene_type:complete